MPKSAKFRVWFDLKIIHAVSLIALFVTLNVAASIAALFVGNELHKGVPSVSVDESGKDLIFTVEFNILSHLSREVHLLSTPVGHREATSVSYNSSFEFFGVGTDGGVRPLQNHYALQPSCQDLELKCHFALKNTTVTNSTDILSGVDLSESESLLLPKEPLRKFPLTQNFVSKCKNQDCESNRLLVFSFHSLSLWGSFYQLDTLSIVSKIRVTSNSTGVFNFSYLTVRPAYIVFQVWIRLCCCFLSSLLLILFCNRMKKFYWKDWLYEQKLTFLVLTILVLESSPSLISSLYKINYSIIFEWMSNLARCLLWGALSYFWIVVIAPSGLRNSFDCFLGVLIALFTSIMCLLPQIIHYHHFTYMFFGLKFSYPLSVFIGVTLLLMYFVRVFYIIYKGFPRTVQKRPVFIVKSVLCVVLILTFSYVISILGFRLISPDFLPNSFPSSSIPNVLVFTAPTIAIHIAAILYLPFPKKPHEESILEENCENETDETTLFSSVD